MRDPQPERQCPVVQFGPLWLWVVGARESTWFHPQFVPGTQNSGWNPDQQKEVEKTTDSAVHSNWKFLIQPKRIHQVIVSLEVHFSIYDMDISNMTYTPLIQGTTDTLLLKPFIVSEFVNNCPLSFSRLAPALPTASTSHWLPLPALSQENSHVYKLGIFKKSLINISCNVCKTNKSYKDIIYTVLFIYMFYTNPHQTMEFYPTIFIKDTLSTYLPTKMLRLARASSF